METVKEFLDEYATELERPLTGSVIQIALGDEADYYGIVNFTDSVQVASTEEGSKRLKTEKNILRKFNLQNNKKPAALKDWPPGYSKHAVDDRVLVCGIPGGVHAVGYFTPGKFHELVGGQEGVNGANFIKNGLTTTMHGQTVVSRSCRVIHYATKAEHSRFTQMVFDAYTKLNRQENLQRKTTVDQTDGGLTFEYVVNERKLAHEMLLVYKAMIVNARDASQYTTTTAKSSSSAARPSTTKSSSSAAAAAAAAAATEQEVTDLLLVDEVSMSAMSVQNDEGEVSTSAQNEAVGSWVGKMEGEAANTSSSCNIQ